MAKRRRTKDGGSAVEKADGALCLTFVNTRTKRRRSIGGYGELLDWGLRLRSLDSAGAERLAGLAGGRPEDAAAAFATAEDLRGVLSAVMNARADRTKPPPEACSNCVSQRNLLATLGGQDIGLVRVPLLVAGRKLDRDVRASILRHMNSSKSDARPGAAIKRLDSESGTRTIRQRSP